MPIARPSLTAASLLICALVLSACGGGSETEAERTAQQADDLASRTVVSDSAQPSDADPPALQADGTPASPAPTMRAQAAAVTPVDSEAAIEAGNLLFHDVRLSASGRMSCGTCHVEGSGHADAPGTRLPLGGPLLDQAGMRSSMTGRYLNLTPPFRLSLLGTPSGGYLWDGRADDRFGQAFHGGPFFNPVEQALPGSATEPKALTDLVRSAPYWPQIQALYVDAPEKIASDTALFKEVAVLLEVYQRGDADYNLFDSKFDQVQAGKASFTEAEARGWALFSNPQRGNCVACHTASLTKTSLFTNFGYAALGVPRNHAGPKNADPAYFDLGLCAREKARTNNVADLLVKLLPRYCGLFKTPTLRNVEHTGPYFHNAAVTTLEDAVRFHFERDTQAARWYRKADGSADRRYNDLPWYYRGNLAAGRPFNGAWQPGNQDIADLLAFLKTLNDADQGTGTPH
ncbi:cytochrome-c peroxidase [Aquabacterium sp. OR-4]|uniref:cytochrome-c peroxidase n=1 Tax=Aquabacterium sp. OR-4 TaxID=2978127 RepID=UPI0021B3FE46|nr:cytochrome c peroxidase [Aquabacterium sp. OR-4]MDT7834820.1 cytochrome c peroxidase [Aquabacterium sp. OR-4]